MSSDPIEWRCQRTLCGAPLDHTLDFYDVPPRFCSERCEMKHEAFRAAVAYWMAAVLAFLAEIPSHFGGRVVHYLGDNVTSLRRNTPPRTEGGRRVVTPKRSCNGCKSEIGDANQAEIEAAFNGRELPDVRGECVFCAGDVDTVPATSVGDEVLYRCADTGKWILGAVTVVASDALRLNLSTGFIAIDVKHGFGPRQWATLDEVVAHQAQASTDGASA